MKRLRIVLGALCVFFIIDSCALVDPSEAAMARSQPTFPQEYVEGRQGPSGGLGGDYCTTNEEHPDWRLSSMNVRSGDFIDAVDLSFSVPGAPEDTRRHCGGDGGHPNELLILDPGDFIVRVTGKYGQYVDYLYVQTKSGKQRSFGNQNSHASGYFDYQATAGTAISGFIIRRGDYVDAIGVILRKQP